MPFKNIDNPWLVKTLLSILTVFGVIFGTALTPLLIVLFNPDAQGKVDAYSMLDPTHWYLWGAIGGGCFGFLLATGILVQLSRQAAQEEREKASDAHASPAH